MAPRKLTQAIILAGGSGERLRPFTLALPKPLVSVHGKPFICYLIDRLKAQGITEVLILAGYMAGEFDVLKDIYAEHDSLNIKIMATSPEFQTGNRVLLASDEIADEFILLYGDNYWPFDFDNLEQKFFEGGREGQIVIYENTDYYSSSNICLDKNKRITLYDTSRRSPHATHVDLGFGIYKKKVLSYLDLNKNLSFEKQVYKALIDKRELGAVCTRHRYYTLTNIERMGPLIHVLSDQKTIFLNENSIYDRDMLLSDKGLSLDKVWKPGALELIKKCSAASADVFLLSFWPEISMGLISQPKVDLIHRETKAENKREEY